MPPTSILSFRLLKKGCIPIIAVGTYPVPGKERLNQLFRYAQQVRYANEKPVVLALPVQATIVAKNISLTKCSFPFLFFVLSRQ